MELTKEEKEKVAEMQAKIVDESVKRQEWIQKHVKNYYRALNGGKLSPEEILILGVDVILSGYSMVARFSDMAAQNVDERLNTMASVRETINGMLLQSYLNRDVVAAQVANSAMHNFKSGSKLIKDVK